MLLNGPKIRRMRENLGMTGRDLCEAASLSKAYLSQIEQNDRGCSPNTAARLAAALEVAIVDLRRSDEEALEALD